MKKTKKLLALALALMLSLSCMAMSAMAAEDEEIMPLGAGIDCPECGRLCNVRDIYSTIQRYCTDNEGKHSHKVVYRDSYTCPFHGTTYGPMEDLGCVKG